MPDIVVGTGRAGERAERVAIAAPLLGGVAARAGVAVGLAALFYALNPSWFGDAPWYALEIEGGQPLRPDWAHLLWRPLGKSVWRAAHAVGLPLESLTVLRLLSSFAAAGVCLLTQALALRLGAPRGTALAAAALVAGSNSYLTIGGSGAAVTAAALLGVAAALVLLRPNGAEWQIRHGVVAGAAMGASWAFWAPAVLLFPVVFVIAILRATGGWERRLVRAAAVCAVGVAAIVALSAFTYVVLVQSPNGPGVLEWISGHYDVRLFTTESRLAGAAFAALYGFVYLGDLGRSLKGLLLGDGTSVRAEDLLGWGLLAAGVLLLLGAAAAGLAVRWRRRDAVAARLGVVGLAAALPAVGFAALWGASGEQPLALPLPFLAVPLTWGLSPLAGGLDDAAAARRGTAVWAAVACIWTANIVTRAIPSLLGRGEAVTALGEVARRHLPAQSLVVVTGQDFGIDVVSSAAYFSQLDVLNLMDDVATHGAGGWDQRLRSRIAATLTQRRSVALLSDLLGEPTPGGIGLNVVQHPVPWLADVTSMFADWRRVGQWQLRQYRFIILQPPESARP